jgi:two-component system, OmpR family, sensor histidine kinase PhoQ
LNRAGGLSLNTRLLIAASVVLAAFLGLTGLTLDGAFRESALAATREQLKVQIYSLLAAAELDDSEKLAVPKRLPEVRLDTPGSGLYAQVNDAAGDVVWRSRSMLGLSLPFAAIYRTGEPAFHELESAEGARFFALGLGVVWEASPQKRFGYTFYVAESTEPFNALVGGFRRSLWAWLLAAALVLLGVQGFIWRWGLAPLRRVALEVAEIEAGRRDELSSAYPKELRLLTESLNTFLRNRSAHLDRYRNALADLAHSLKTPLAVIRGAVEKRERGEGFQETLEEQIERINKAVDYQLQRAAASGRTVLAVPVAIAPLVHKLQQSFAKVYAGKALRFNFCLDSRTVFHGDESDLLEVLGNLLDNACKWAQREVALRVTVNGEPPGLLLEVEDDGPGIPENLYKLISQRGMRGDQNVAGHGIGLAVVREIVEQVYGGTLEFGRTERGGALVRVRL